MDSTDARWLVGPEAAAELALAAAEPDPGSLAAAERLRRRLPPGRAAAVAAQVALRRRAGAKFGERAEELFFTADGLEQASRSAVAAWRARRFADAGVTRVVDLGCGIGADALALVDAGIAVDAVDTDEVTAVLAAANLGCPLVEPAETPSTSSRRTPGSPSRPRAPVGAIGPDRPLVEPAETLSPSSRRMPGSPSHASASADAVASDHPLVELVETRSSRVHLGDATQLWGQLAADGVGVFSDPARRTASGRSWRVEDLSPPWEFVTGLLDGSRPAAVKLGPGLAHRLIPDGVAATWVSDHGDLVELALWAGCGEWGTDRLAVLLPGEHTLAGGEASEIPGAGPVGRYLYEPDPAVIRAGAIGPLAALLDARPVSDGIAYLTADDARPTPFATCFEVLDVMDASEKSLRAWLRREGIGVLEIKKRGVDIDPAVLRRRLKVSPGRATPHQATLVLTPTTHGVRALVVRRLPADGS